MSFKNTFFLFKLIYVSILSLKTTLKNTNLRAEIFAAKKLCTDGKKLTLGNFNFKINVTDKTLLSGEKNFGEKYTLKWFKCEYTHFIHTSNNNKNIGVLSFLVRSALEMKQRFGDILKIPKHTVIS